MKQLHRSYKLQHRYIQQLQNHHSYHKHLVVD
jgi:hypothetical protein